MSRTRIGSTEGNHAPSTKKSSSLAIVIPGRLFQFVSLTDKVLHFQSKAHIRVTHQFDVRVAYLIGIAGGTGSGKSTVVRALLDRFGGVCMDLDSYYLDRSAISAEERDDLNYDEPAAIDHILLIEHLKRLKAGESVQKPRYSFHTHTRVGIETVTSARLILVDGLFTLWWEDVRRLLDLKVFVHAPADRRLIRRIQRDVVERGRDLESVLRQYLQTVRPMHDLYVEPTRVHADLVLNNGATVRECLESLIVAVEGIVGGAQPNEES